MIEQSFPNEISTGWVENLAIEELNMNESGIVNFHEFLNPSHLLEESSIHFMDLIRDRFELYAQKFNEYRGNAQNGAQIKIFKIANTVNDFMLFRNSLRLVINRKANDLITIGFLSNNGELLPGKINDNAFTKNSQHEIKAHLGPFNKITWRFQGEAIDIESLVKFYLSEFIRNSAR